MANPRYTYPDPTLSRWQAAVAEVDRRRRSVGSRTAAATSQRLSRPNPLAGKDLAAPAHLLGSALCARREITSAMLAEPPVQPQLAVAADCAKAAARFLWAEISGNQEEAAKLAVELKYAECDVGGWSECLTAYLAYKAAGAAPPYHPDRNIVIDIGTNAKLAIVGDWGTGDAVAINLLEQVASLKPDVLVHLGDVYYAGTHSEQQANFLDICRQILGSGVALVSLCGNHDVYSGGDGYDWLVQTIGQQASYFCLRNPHWQILAMDTGHNDNNPMTVSTNMTSLVKDASWSEADWHLARIRQPEGRKTILLSHHPLFSSFASVGSIAGKAYAYNPNLFADFESVLSEVVWWFWGHEHTLAIYDPYMGLARGRCLGASAVPVFTDQQKYEAATGLETVANLPLPQWNPAGELGNNGTDYAHAFAILTLNGASAKVDYYQVPVLGTASRLAVDDTA